MRFAYRTNGLPGIGGGAFTPTYSHTPQGVSAGDLRTTALMGTIPVRSPRPAALNDSSLGGPYNQPSQGLDGPNIGAVYAGYGTGAFRPAKGRIAHDAIFPWGGVSHVDGCYPPMPIYSDNVAPVPAQDSTRVAQTLMRAVRIGGLRVTRNPRPLPRWPTYGRVLGIGQSA